MQDEIKKVLVVDDDVDILEFLQELLELEGYSVMVTEKADYVETLQNGGLPDLILLDVFLSGKDGRDIARQLKGRVDTRHIPIVMFSAHPNAEKTAREAGANDFLPKPFEIDDLLAKIEQHI